MVDILSTLEPQCVWKFFNDIRKIPRPSKQEEQMRQYLVKFAQDHKLAYKQDQVGNVVICKAASKGKEKTPGVVLQCHMDMVCEKDENVKHDWNKDPIQIRKVDEFVYATGTTLGADNGIGMAVALAILESKDLVHGPLECLFTIDEETGLNGARGLTSDFLQGRRMLNLDSEEEGDIYIGCAGGGNTTLTLPLQWQPGPADTTCLKMIIRGLQGGHSGVDINLGRGNALEILVRFLWQLAPKYAVSLKSIEGGDKLNAITRSAFALLALPKKNKDNFCAEARKFFENIKGEYGKIEPNMELNFEDVAPFAQVLEKNVQEKLLHVLRAQPHGVLAMNPDIPGLVNTSNNFAKVAFNEKDNTCLVYTSSRSSLKDALESTRHKVEAIGRLAGAKVEHNESYPGWKPNLDSALLKIVEKVYQQVFGKKPPVKAMHAGLECGIIGEKITGMDMVSIGPLLEHPHSPQERLHIASVGRFWEALKKILAEIAA